MQTVFLWQTSEKRPFQNSIWWVLPGRTLCTRLITKQAFILVPMVQVRNFVITRLLLSWTIREFLTSMSQSVHEGEIHAQLAQLGTDNVKGCRLLYFTGWQQFNVPMAWRMISQRRVIAWRRMIPEVNDTTTENDTTEENEHSVHWTMLVNCFETSLLTARSPNFSNKLFASISAGTVDTRHLSIWYFQSLPANKAVLGQCWRYTGEYCLYRATVQAVLIFKPVHRADYSGRGVSGCTDLALAQCWQNFNIFLQGAPM